MAHQLAGNPHISIGETDLELKIEVFTDGTTTSAFLIAPEDGPLTYQAKGVARRRKGDPRKPEVGETLALSRALRALADRYEQKAEELSR